MNLKRLFMLQSIIDAIFLNPMNGLNILLISFPFNFQFRSILNIISTAKETVKKSIQQETQTTIKCSKVKSNGVNQRIVEIKGTTHLDVFSARKRIKSIASDGQNKKQKRPQPTHFTCVKITDPIIKENYVKFKVKYGIFFVLCLFWSKTLNIV